MSAGLAVQQTAARSLLEVHVDTGIDLYCWPEVLPFVRDALPPVEVADALGEPVDISHEVALAALEARLLVRAGLEVAFPDLVLPAFRIRP